MSNTTNNKYKNYSRRHRYSGKPSARPSGKSSGKPGLDLSKYISKKQEFILPEPYRHKHAFADFHIGAGLLQQIIRNGYAIPTEIQDKTIPHILSGQDLIGIAGTGTGKTAAFLIPIIQRLTERPENHSALIIAPTRELASQILDEFIKISRGLNLYATALIGGVGIDRSIKALRKTNHVIIGTPGRLIDMAKRRYLSFEQFSTLVLDEFDRMLDMGFQDDIRYINERMTGKKQSLLFSATMDESQKTILNSITRLPVKVTASAGPQYTHAIEQDVVHIPRDRKKIEILHGLIADRGDQKILLFCRTRRMVKEVHKNLRLLGIPADMIHGDISQRARETALRKFRNGQTHVLVATDVVARGIDVIDVSLVINYEVPGNYTDYIHRIGRTGRAGKTGKAITLID